MDDCSVILDRQGRGPLDLSRYFSGSNFSSNAVGGFGSFNLSLPGGADRWKSQIGYLDRISVTAGPRVIWEGRVEDIGLSLSGGEMSASLQGFGLARYLDDASLRLVYVTSAISWQTPISGTMTGRVFRPSYFSISAGGQGTVTAIGNEGSAPLTNSASWIYFGATGMAWTRYYLSYICTKTAVTQLLTGLLAESSNGTAWGAPTSFASLTTVTGFTNLSSQAYVALGGQKVAAGTFGDSDKFTANSFKLFGTGVTEDTGQSIYGGSILRDLIGRIVGIDVGTIDDGSDYAIDEMASLTRQKARAYIDQVAGYYAREWAVWESDTPGVGRFDWETPNLDEHHWVVTLADLTSLDLQGSTNEEHKTTYVLYTDALTQTAAEASAVSTNRRNPYVRGGITKDGIANASLPLTSTGASQLATKLNRDFGSWPPVTGQITLPAQATIAHATMGQRPAYQIRGGDNLTISDLPKTDLMQPGRDGETLFHVVSCEVDMAQNTVSLTIDGQQSRADVILARLAAVTRTLTG